jgi:hypothetical protein
MSDRRRLPSRRRSETFDLDAGGLRFTCTASWHPDGSLGELFLTNHKSNSAADTNARDSAIAFSIAIQQAPIPKRSAAPCAATNKATPADHWVSRSIACLEFRPSRKNPHRADNRGPIVNSKGIKP